MTYILTIPEKLNEVCDKYNTRISLMPPAISIEARFNNKGALSSGTIVLGAFTSLDLMISVTYHELGHLVLGHTNVHKVGYKEERQCWLWALKQMYIDGYTIPYHIKRQCVRSLNTYKAKNDESNH